MSTINPPLSDETIQSLEKRVKKLGMEKSYLQLLIRMMERLSQVSEMEKTVESIPSIILDSIGGTNVTLYYFLNDTLFSMDAYGNAYEVKSLSDKTVEAVLKSGEAQLIEHDFANTLMKTTEFSKGWTWVYPLQVPGELIGVLKLENVHIGMDEWEKELPTFFNYSALLLKNAIVGHYRLELNRQLEEKVIKEVTKRMEQERMLIQQSKLAAMGEMIGSIAHQWRQPLNALNVNIENLEFDYEEGLITKDFLDKFITDQTKTLQYMSKTIDTFRDFFRIDKKKSPFSVKEAIEKSVNIQSAQLKVHGITLTVAGEDFRVDGYENEFQQVIMNLISNAKDAIEEAGEKNGQINISLSGNTVIVDDNGGGIHDEIINRIFEPYFTTKEQGKGIGMGLYISKMILEDNMGGKIRAMNLDRGARFIIDLENKNDR